MSLNSASVSNIHFSSASDNWATPKAFFNKLNKTFSFELDPCASHQNAKCRRYFTIEDNGLLKQWEGKVYMNPPYGRSIGEWVKKAFEHDNIVVCLLPARTDTKWWQEYCLKADCIHFIREDSSLMMVKTAHLSPLQLSSLICLNEEKDVEQWQIFFC